MMIKQRKLVNWIDGFYAYTAGLPSPDLFRKWGAISAVAGALERRVWITTNVAPLYPNLFCVLVGPPGVGKTVVTRTVQKLWQSLDDHHLASSSVSKASLMDELREAERKGVVTNKDGQGGFGQFNFNSLKILANELGVLIPGYDNEFMNVLTDVYDGHPYSERKRSAALKFMIDKPQLNLLAATTPSYLNNVMPEGAWTQGFISRVNLIYSGDSHLQDLFSDNSRNEKLGKELTFDLNSIGKLYGPMQFEPDARIGFTQWHLAGGPPQPDHPKLATYNIRRSAHLLKLCMVASASSGDSLNITLENFTEALDWLLEAESHMPDIFKAMNAGGDSTVINEAWHFLYTLYIKDKKPILENRLVNFIQQRTPAHNVMKIVEIMQKAGLIKRQMNTMGLHEVVPEGRKQ
jgi:hypothetical protein